MYEDKEFEFPENFFDDYQGRGTADHTQKMSVVQDMMWGHNMKFKIDPYTGKPTGFETDLKRMDEKQRAARLKAYNSRNEAFLKNKPEGKDLAKWKYQRYLRDYLKMHSVG